ncbi:S8 family serine peptidase [Flammeovirga yaeyamensis]|uniref:S8 family serine peptidase n=1 Tax=Flammeovirga yaeyamensis TaxID=367791 RepID=A0AAX1MZU8_9BACT|nr:S8 family serine peptidase [Flammeovirga yaeyamensis]MBB3700208.1 subtilisin family serine protease [Flammeovirga yaeyamensis]NMF37162.1 S8 family serine peptidase [Flammeovirga yaeyamensis]QWG00853.1 S8 family serine peptidase [Flammeovirga yaeyamensis]
MKFHRITLLLFGMIFMGISTFAQQVANSNAVKNGIVKVKFKSEVAGKLSSLPTSFSASSYGSSALVSVAQRYKATPMRRLFEQSPDPILEARHRKHGLHLWYIFEVDPSANIQEVLSAYGEVTDFSFVEGEHPKALSPYQSKTVDITSVTSDDLPFNDDHLPKQWHYDYADQVPAVTEGYDINLFEAWKLNTGSANVIVSVHDEGVDTSHPDLVDNLWVNTLEINGEPGVDDDNNGYVDDIHGWNFTDDQGEIAPQTHGTHVAGTVAATSNNGIGVAGVAGGSGKGDGARIMSMQFLGGGSVEPSYVYAADNGAVISQNSWGYLGQGYYDQSVLDAIDYFIAEAGNYPGSPMKGGIVIFAAGNSNLDGQWWPGYYEKCLTVGAIGPDGKKTSYSNYGEWVDISAPGGESGFGFVASILSTLPEGKYGYLDGTSMACPHVSGVAALVLSNATESMTPERLRQILETSNQPIDHINEGYEGKMGVGNIDTYLALQTDNEIAPTAISDLQLDGIAQEFAVVSWSIPSDEDDTDPEQFLLYVHTEELNNDNLSSARYRFEIPNTGKVGDKVTFEVNDLYGVTDYYFAVVSIDRWGNVSGVSNILMGTTNAGPKVNVNEEAKNISLTTNQANDFNITQNVMIKNEDEGLLRWEFTSRHINTSLSWNYQPIVPNIRKGKDANLADIGTSSASKEAELVANANAVAPMSFETIEKFYGNKFPTTVFGDTDTTLTNSAATIFYVNEEEGFNLTDLRFWLKHDPEKQDVIFEIYEGDVLTEDYLLLTQPYRNSSGKEHTAYVRLNEQLYFESGEKFTVVCHIPAGPLYPLGATTTANPSESHMSLISLDWGNTWISLPQALKGNESFVWNMIAVSNYEHLGEYITLTPGMGEVSGNSELEAQLNVDASTLINGTYNGVGIIHSNDVNEPELRMPIKVTVAEQQPQLASVGSLDFGSVFMGVEKELAITLVNNGYGNFNSVKLTSSSSDFELEAYPKSQVKALGTADYLIKFKPTSIGNINAILKFDGATGVSHEVRLFGVGTEPSEINVDPMNQIVDNVTIGDEVKTSVTVSNNGAYPLTYFIPGFADESVTDAWEGDFHTYGYRPRVSHKGETNYEWIEIKDTGVNITDFMKLHDRNLKETQYYPIELPFEFPFYNEKYSTLYFTPQVMMAFSDSVRISNAPRLEYFGGGLAAMVSAIGTEHVFVQQGEVFYQVESDRLIVQYEGISQRNKLYDQVTLQFVIYDNGTIRINYKDIEDKSANELKYWHVLIQNSERNDGFRLAGYGGLKYDNQNLNMTWMNEMSIEFTYPGPDIITDITNASDVLMPGESNTLDITLNTSELYEGVINRNINIVHDDPINNSQLPNIQLNIVDGGVASMELQKDTIDFGEIYQGKVFSENFFVKNTGTADLNVTNIQVNSDRFELEGPIATSVKSDHSQTYKITALSDLIGLNTAEIEITLEDNSKEMMTVLADIKKAPAIDVDTTSINFALDYGTKDQFDLTINNTGDTTLQVAASGSDWLYEDRMGASSLDTVNRFTYTYRKSTDEFGAPEYSWIEIVGLEGTEHINHDSVDIFEAEGCWYPVDLPWEFNYYGKPYSSMHIGFNGAITFAGLLEREWFNVKLPTDRAPNSILPLWSPSGYNTGKWGSENVGVFYHIFDYKIVVTFQYLDNVFGMGDPTSVQAILYKDGTMKFQYKTEERGSDQMSNLSTIGLQNEDLSDYVLISHQKALNFGKGYAIVVSPASKVMVEVGESVTKTLTVDATKVYGGTHEASVIIQSNAPNRERLEKKVMLTVTGAPQLDIPSEVNYGEVVVESLGSKYKDFIKEVTIKNTGTQQLQIDAITLVNADELKGEYEADNGFGGTFWRDVKYMRDPIVLAPNTSSGFRLKLSPSEPKVIDDTVKLTLSDGTVHKIVVDGEAVLPPVMDIEEDEVLVQLNTNTEEKATSFNLGNDGASVLNYDLTVNYFRETSFNPAARSQSFNQVVLSKKEAEVSNKLVSYAVQDDFNRVFYHGSSDQPDTYVGFVGQADFIGATRFNGGTDGFNLSHVMTYVNYENLESGEISVEIRAGGESIYDAAVVSKATYSFINNEPGEGVGEWIEVALDDVVAIYPNEDFYVIFSYPFEINYPQGISKGERSINRFMYQFDGEWFDLQSGGFASDIYMVKAAEMDYVNNAWIILDQVDGNVEAGTNADVNFTVKAAEHMLNDQHAEIVVRSNDIKTPQQNVKVTLSMNQAPNTDDLYDQYEVMENDTLHIAFTVTDKEGHDFTVETAHEELTLVHDNGNVSMSLPTDHESAGDYTFEVELKDEHGMATMKSINVAVIDVNRAPVQAIMDTLKFNIDESVYHEAQISDYVMDEDGDDITFSQPSVVSDHLQVFMDQEKVVFKLNEVGESSLRVMATDHKGESTTLEIPVIIYDNSSLEGPTSIDLDLLSNVKVYPNPAEHVVNIECPEVTSGRMIISLMSLEGKLQFTEEVMGNKASLDVSQLTTGIYLVSVESNVKKTIRKVVVK